MARGAGHVDDERLHDSLAEDLGSLSSGSDIVQERWRARLSVPSFVAATMLLFAVCVWLLTTKGTGQGPKSGTFELLEVKQQVYGSQGTAGTYNSGNPVPLPVPVPSPGGTAGTGAYGTAGTGTGAYGTAGTGTGGYATAGTAANAAGSSYGTAGGSYAPVAAPATAGTAYGAAPEAGTAYGAAPEAAGGAAAPWADSSYYYGPTTTQYLGPVEFSGNGGPRTIAGTKVIPTGTGDDLTDMDTNHDPAPAPPPSYASTTNPPMELYMYRAQSDKNYPMRNVNLADLPGVMWYLHNEIVGFPDKENSIRHFGITRIIRFKVTVLNPPEFFGEHQSKFGPFVSFGAGKCSVPNCDSIWKKFGGLVGCQTADKKVAAYENKWQTQPMGQGGCTQCNGPMWFSLPGPCPSHEYGAKSASCIWETPGGDCGPGNAVTGAKDCTYFAKWYGEVSLDEMLNFTLADGTRTDFKGFTAEGGQEYDKLTDRGTFTTFWDGILNKTNNDRRQETVRWWFGNKYPKYPLELGERDVQCDWGGWHAGEFGSDPVPGADAPR